MLGTPEPLRSGTWLRGALAALACVVTTACGLPALGGSQTAPSVAPSTITVTVTATPSPAPPAATPGSRDTGLPQVGGAYADAFVRAWGLGDKQAADRYATTDVMNALFAYPGYRGGSTWARNRLYVQDGRTQVVYRDASGVELFLLLDNAILARGGDGAIVSTDYSARDTAPSTGGGAVPAGLPRDPAEYANQLIRAWGVGDWSHADRYAGDGAMAVIFAGGSRGGPTWSTVTVRDDVAVSRNSRTGSVLRLYLDLNRITAGAEDGVYAASIGGS